MIAAPCPLARFQHQSSFDRIAMHVAQLLDPLLVGEDDEIVEARLPDAAAFDRSAPQRKLLAVVSLAQPRKQASGDPCLMACMTTEGLPRSGSVSSRWTCSGMRTYPTTLKR